MLVTLDSDKCMGCGLCAQITPDVFMMDGELGIAKVIREDGSEAVPQAVRSCPVSCIRVK